MDALSRRAWKASPHSGPERRRPTLRPDETRSGSSTAARRVGRPVARPRHQQRKVARSSWRYRCLHPDDPEARQSAPRQPHRVGRDGRLARRDVANHHPGVVECREGELGNGVTRIPQRLNRPTSGGTQPEPCGGRKRGRQKPPRTRAESPRSRPDAALESSPAHPRITCRLPGRLSPSRASANVRWRRSGSELSLVPRRGIPDSTTPILCRTTSRAVFHVKR